MTKKIISILLSVLMIFSTLSFSTFAEENIELNLGTALVDGANVKVPVTLNAMPGDFDKLASVYMEYYYDSDVLTYVDTESAAVVLGDGHSRDGGISWFDSNSQVEITDETVLFYLLFTANAEETTTIGIAKAEIGASNRALNKPATNKITLFAPEGTISLDAGIVDNTVEVDVVLDKLPGDITDLASVYMNYTYNQDLLIYKETVAGAVDVADGLSATNGSISWYYTDNAVDAIDNTVLFTLVFDIADGAEGTAYVELTKVELADSGRVISKNVNYAGTQFDIVAEDEVQSILFDEPVIDGAKLKVPVILEGMPEDIKDIASFTLEYTYDTDKLVYAGTTSGVLAVDSTSARGGSISWAYNLAGLEPVTDVTAPLFTLEFDIVSGAEGEVELDMTDWEVSDSDRVISQLVGGHCYCFELPAAVVEPTITFGPAVVDGTKVSVPVSLNVLPEGIEDIASFTMPYKYSTDLLTFAGVKAGALNVDGATVSDDNVSWYKNPDAVTDISTPLFTLEFTVNDSVEGIAYIDPVSVEIAASSHAIAKDVKLEGTKVTVVGGTPAPVVVGIKTNINEISIPLNTPDAIEYIKKNLKVYTVYSDGSEVAVTSGYTVAIVDGAIQVGYGRFDSDVDLAYEKAEVKAGSAEVTGTERTFKIPVTMQGIPADIANVAAVTVEYTYDAGIEYVGTEAGVIPVDAATTTAGKVSWFSSSAPITEIDNATLFTLVFKAPCDVAAEFELALDVEIGESDKTSASITPVNGTVKVVAVEHSWSEWETTTAPTLDADGQQTRVCANCDEIETRPIVLTDVTINKDALDVPYRFHSQGTEKKMDYIKSQIVATAVFSDGTEIVIPEPTYTDNGDSVGVAFKGISKPVAVTLGAAPAKPEVYPDIPQTGEGREIIVPVVLPVIPDEIIDAIGGTLESVDIEFTVDTSDLTREDGTPVDADDIDVAIDVVVDNTNNTAEIVITITTPCDVEGSAVLDITGIKLNDIPYNDAFELQDIVVNVTAQPCEYGEWQTHPESEPTDYKNGKEIRYCKICDGFEERPIKIVSLEHAKTIITVPYANHSGKTAAEIAEYLKSLGTLAKATLTNGYVADVDNADVVVTVDITAPKAVITYANAYNPATGETYEAKCEIALEFTPGDSTGDDGYGGSGGGGAYRPGNQGGNGGGVTIVPTTPSGTFNDLPTTHYAYNAIKDLYDRGIVTGDGNGNINPDMGITREETAKIALLINGIDVEKGLPIDFDDKASVSAWAYDYVATAIKHGVLKGYGDGTVRPRDIVSREEMVAIIIRTLNVQINGEVNPKFADVASDRWSAGYIVAASDLGLITGYTDGSFKPASDITRAEAFTIYHRVLKFKESLIAAIQ